MPVNYEFIQLLKITDNPESTIFFGLRKKLEKQTVHLRVFVNNSFIYGLYHTLIKFALLWYFTLYLGTTFKLQFNVFQDLQNLKSNIFKCIYIIPSFKLNSKYV